MIKPDEQFNILIVDDMPHNIQIVANILINEGYQMAFARDGHSALEKVKNIEFDLILLDVMMPAMDGFEVCAKLNENPLTREIPVIFLTAKSDISSIVKGFEIGAVDYISKPFSDAELKARVKTHLQMKRTRENLQKANATKDRFFSIIAHDLRNPFNHILGFSEILLEKFDTLDDERKKSFVKNIYGSSQQTHKLLENLLSWARIQLGKIEWEPVKLDLGMNIAENISLLSNQAEEKEIILESKVTEKTYITADFNMLNTVLRNLIGNAIKFTPKGGNVWIESEGNASMVEISVCDTGIGISEEDIQKLFRIDEHYTMVGTEEESGTGLGLILCKEFIEQNGGTITVDSIPNNGSTFTFTVPNTQP